jgi:hypothetical protein
MTYDKRLSNIPRGNMIELENNPGQVWILDEVREKTVCEGTRRRHPMRLRSRFKARLRDVKTGKIRETWFAEYIHCRIIKEN